MHLTLYCCCQLISIKNWYCVADLRFKNDVEFITIVIGKGVKGIKQSKIVEDKSIKENKW